MYTRNGNGLIAILCYFCLDFNLFLINRTHTPFTRKPQPFPSKMPRPFPLSLSTAASPSYTLLAEQYRSKGQQQTPNITYIYIPAYGSRNTAAGAHRTKQQGHTAPSSRDTTTTAGPLLAGAQKISCGKPVLEQRRTSKAYVR